MSQVYGISDEEMKAVTAGVEGSSNLTLDGAKGQIVFHQEQHSENGLRRNFRYVCLPSGCFLTG